MTWKKTALETLDIFNKIYEQKYLKN